MTKARLIELTIVVLFLWTVALIGTSIVMRSSETKLTCIPRCAPHPVLRMKGDVCVCDMGVEYR